MRARHAYIDPSKASRAEQTGQKEGRQMAHHRVHPIHVIVVITKEAAQWLPSYTEASPLSQADRQAARQLTFSSVASAVRSCSSVRRVSAVTCSASSSAARDSLCAICRQGQGKDTDDEEGEERGKRTGGAARDVMMTSILVCAQGSGGEGGQAVRQTGSGTVRKAGMCDALCGGGGEGAPGCGARPPGACRRSSRQTPCPAEPLQRHRDKDGSRDRERLK